MRKRFTLLPPVVEEGRAPFHPVTPYPNQTRFVARACAQLGYRFTDLDDGGGYLFSVSDGVHEFVSGSGLIGTYPLNTAPAYCVSRDKFHTHVVLERTGLPTIASQLFFVRDDYARLRGPGRERGDAEAAFARAEKPLFCKPNQGSRGDFAEIVHDDAGFGDYLMRVAARYDAILLQPLLTGDEYRVFTIDGDAIFATRKSELRLVGDGHSSLRQLLRMHNRQFDRSGVSPLTEENALAAIASREGVRGEDIPAAGRAVAIPGRRNLSAGGDVKSSPPTFRHRSRISPCVRHARSDCVLRVSTFSTFRRAAFFGPDDHRGQRQSCDCRVSKRSAAAMWSTKSGQPFSPAALPNCGCRRPCHD